MGTRSSNSEICRMKVLEKFIKLKPPLFEGGSDPVAAELWLNSVKTMFDSIGVLQEYRVGFATYLFEGSAEEWWDLRGYNGITKWKRFETLFRNMYIVQSPNQDMIAQFHRLKQKDTTVAEYHDAFVALCRYDPVTTAHSVLKCDRFRKGLRSDIRLQLALFAFTDFDELVTVAQRIETDYNERSRKTRRDLDHMSGQSGASSDYSECFLCGSVCPEKCDCPSRQLENTTVAEYLAGFVEHFRLSDPITAVDRIWMCIKFKQGLSPNISSLLKNVTFRDFPAVVEAAQCAEAVFDQNNREKKSGKDRKKKKQKQRQDRSSSYAPFSLRFDPYSRHAAVFSPGNNLRVQSGFENGTVPGESSAIPASIPTSELKISSEKKL